MSKSLKRTRTQIADLSEDRKLTTEELGQISGGYKSILLSAMGWQQTYNKSMVKGCNGMVPDDTTDWTKDGIFVESRGY